MRPHALINTTKCLLFTCGVVISALCLVPSVLGQTATATLSGTVEDENGAVIPGVAVTAVNNGTQLTRHATTNEQGYFIIPLLPPGRYTVKAQARDFAPVDFTDVVLNVGDQKALQLHLKAGNIAEMVKIEGGAPLIDESPAVGTVIDRQFIGNLPLNGRSFQSLIALTPGVTLTKTSFDEQGQFSVNGQRPDANYFTVDGVSANIGVSAGSNLGQSGAGSLPGLGATGGTNNLVSIDALEEFKIQTSTYAPEFGRTPGGQVQIVTRSGTNTFHGSLFEYFRNDALDAADWFVNANRLRKPPLKQHDFGGTFGGPILLPRFGEAGRQPFYNGRNRTFFFFSYEGLRLKLPQVATSLVPSFDTRQSAPPQIRPFLNAFPLPNGPAAASGLAPFSASYSNPSELDAVSLRLDHVTGSRLTLFGRYNHAPSRSAQRGQSFSLNTLGHTIFKTKTLTVGATWAITSNVSNDFRINWSRNEGRSVTEMDTFGGAAPLDDGLIFPPPFSRRDDQFQVLISGGDKTFYRVADRPVNNAQRQFNAVDNLSIIVGPHQMKAGFDYRRLTPVNEQFRNAIAVQFASASQMISGIARSLTVDSFKGARFPQFMNVSLYAQDTWRARDRLTLTYGLRWELNPAPTEKNGNHPFAVRGVDDPSTIALEPRGSKLYRTTYTNFAPRVGAAYRLSQSKGRETTVRGGFGVFYDLGTGPVANAFGSTYPYRASVTTQNAVFPLVPSAVVIPAVNPNPPFPSVSVFEPDIELPYTYQWNLAVEQSLGASQTVSASYVAAVGRRLLRQELIRTPNANFSGNVLITKNTATSDYHALQAQFTRRLTRGLQALMSYSWAHSIDIASNDSSINVSTKFIDPRRDRGPSDFDVRHTFSAAATYALPSPFEHSAAGWALADWTIDAIFTARSRTPVNVITTTDLLGLGVFASTRPDLIQGVPLYLENSNVAGGREINRAAFRTNFTGRQGTLGRNALRGFPVSQVDLALRRQFNLREAVNLQLRVEFFNVFNHPNFADPVSDLASSSFGRSQSMLGRGLGSGGLLGGFNPLYQIGGPRSIQLSLKFLF
jgi:hypothetical protein